MSKTYSDIPVVNSTHSKADSVANSYLSMVYSDVPNGNSSLSKEYSDIPTPDSPPSKAYTDILLPIHLVSRG